MLVVAAVFLGAISLARLPVDLLPDVSYPQLVVSTRYAGVGPAEIERFVTEPVEQQVSTVPGVERVESASRDGVSLVTLRFAWGTDMDFAALNVREKLDNLRDALPERADRPTVLRTDPSAEPVLAVSVAGEGDPAVLQDLAESVFRRRLEQIDGVAEAAVTGGVEREIHVDVDPDALRSRRLSIGDVAAALDAANVSAPGGSVRRGRYRYAIRTLGELADVSEIGDVRIPPPAGDSLGRPVALRDVATVDDGFQERESMARFDGRDAVGLLVFKEAGANTVRVARAVDGVLDQLRGQYPELSIAVATSQAGFVSAAIGNVVQALVLGGALAFLVLILFLRDVRYPVAIALAIPISVVVTFALLDVAGVSLNVMTLGGLALGVGMLVDNSIVVLENVFRHREMGASPVEAAAMGAEEVQAAITASTLTTIAVFGPIVYVQGVAGALFGDLSWAVTFSLLVSLAVAITLLPTMAARWTGDVGTRGNAAGGAGEPAPAGAGEPGPAGARRGPLRRPLAAFDRAFERFAAAYERALAWALDHRRAVALGTLGFVLLATAVGFALRRDVLPRVDQGEFTARLELPRGSPLERTAEAAFRLEDALRADPGVDAVFTRVGRQAAVAGFQDEESGLNTAVLEVRLKPGASTDRVLARLRRVVARLPEGSVAFETGTATALGRLLGGGESDLSVRVRGEDLDAALTYARQVEGRVGRVRSLANVRLGTEIGQPEVRVEIDRESAASYGIEPRRVAQAVEDYMQGTVATRFVDFDRRVPVVVRLPDSARRSLASLASITVDDVPVTQMIRTIEGEAPTEIRRVDQNRQVSVLADVASGGIAAAASNIRAAHRRRSAAAGPARGRGGENEELRQSFRGLGFAFLLAMLLVYMILAAQFESLLHPFVVLLAVPMGVDRRGAGARRRRRRAELAEPHRRRRARRDRRERRRGQGRLRQPHAPGRHAGAGGADRGGPRAAAAHRHDHGDDALRRAADGAGPRARRGTAEAAGARRVRRPARVDGADPPGRARRLRGGGGGARAGGPCAGQGSGLGGGARAGGSVAEAGGRGPVRRGSVRSGPVRRGPVRRGPQAGVGPARPAPPPATFDARGASRRLCAIRAAFSGLIRRGRPAPRAAGRIRPDFSARCDRGGRRPRRVSNPADAPHREQPTHGRLQPPPAPTAPRRQPPHRRKSPSQRRAPRRRSSMSRTSP